MLTWITTVVFFLLYNNYKNFKTPAASPSVGAGQVGCPKALLLSSSPVDVRLLSALKADNKRTSTRQQADNERLRLFSFDIEKYLYFCSQKRDTMNWVILILAGLCEVGFAFCLGKVKGLTGLPYWEWMGAFAFFYVLSAILLAKATETIPIGTAYPVWTGIGALGSVVVGIFIFHEPATFWRLFFITTLTISIIGLKAVS